jgi:hypothetical protein
MSRNDDPFDVMKAWSLQPSCWTAEEVVISATMTMRSAAPPNRHELRHPLEPFVVAACIVLNALIVGLAIVLVWFGSAWLGRHPIAARHVDALRAIAIGGILAFPGTALGRHVRAYADRGNGISLSKAQLSLCNELLVKACRRLGVDELPDLYLVPRSDLDTMSAAYSIVGKRSLIAISTELFGREWEKNERAISFSIGRAVGALKLGHTRWWLELLTAYGVRLPFLRTPMRAVFAFSRVGAARPSSRKVSAASSFRRQARSWYGRSMLHPSSIKRCTTGASGPSSRAWDGSSRISCSARASSITRSSSITSATSLRPPAPREQRRPRARTAPSRRRRPSRLCCRIARASTAA